VRENAINARIGVATSTPRITSPTSMYSTAASSRGAS
jgi:hypothetical protein